MAEEKDKQYLGHTKEELIENTLIAAIMAGVSFTLTFVGMWVRVWVREKVKPR